MNRVAIIGTGLIGTSIGLALKRAKLQDVEIIGHDREPEHAAKAKKLGAVDRTEWNLIRTVERAGLIVLAVPVKAIREIFEVTAPHLPEGAIITDTASTKAEVLRWADELLPETVHFVGGHPMAGKELSGPDAADPDLFKGAVYCVVPSVRASERAVDTVVNLVSLLGAEPYFVDAAEHDSFVAAVSHLPIVISSALVASTTRSPAWREMAKVAASAYRDLTRLASGDPVMNRDIMLTNRESIIRWIDLFIEELKRYRALIAEGGPALGEEFERTHAARERWLRSPRTVGVEPGPRVPGMGESMMSFLFGERLARASQEALRPPKPDENGKKSKSG